MIDGDGLTQQPRDAIQEWRDKLRKFYEDGSADYARRNPEVSPQAHAAVQSLEPVLRAIATVLRREIDQAKRELRAEFRMTRRRRKRMTRAEMDAYVNSLPRAPK